MAVALRRTICRQFIPIESSNPLPGHFTTKGVLSFPAFHLPYQDQNTDNHIAQWTKSIVSDDPPPPPPIPD